MPRTKSEEEPQEEFSPSAIATPKEAHQDDVIKTLQRQVTELTGAIGVLSKKAGIPTRMSERDSSGYGFLRLFGDKVLVGWKTKPGSYAALNQYGQEVDEQYMIMLFEDGTESEPIHYTKFDQVTKINQLPVKILDYCEKNNLGEWRAKRRDTNDDVTVILSEDRGVTYKGKQIIVPVFALN